MQLFVDNLTVIDCSYLHPQHGIEGESWICDIVLHGALNDQSMVMDFGHVKKKIKRAIDEWVDHCLLVPARAAQLSAFDETADGVALSWRDAQGREWQHRSPAAALCVMHSEAITMESVVAYLEKRLMEVVNETVERVEVTLREEVIDGPYYHYSHGLKKHDGNCQRIAHGHRSRLYIWRNGQPAPQLVRAWCEAWKHSYLVSRDDIIEQSDTVIVSGYTSDQGDFWLSAPRSACHILPGDSTVERIAEHIAQVLKAQEPAASFRVKAYEGVQKGAIVER